MKNFKDAVEKLMNAKHVLICGKDSSGKTHILKELVSELSMEYSILVLSNHKEIKMAALRPHMVDSLYKPKDYTNVELSYLETDADYIFIDEHCTNMEEIMKNIDKKLVFVKTVQGEELTDYLDKFDVIIETTKNEDGMPIISSVLTK